MSQNVKLLHLLINLINLDVRRYLLLCKIFLFQSVNRQQFAAAKPQVMGMSGSADMCYFCGKRVYLVERHSAEGVFFHRGCLKCEYCSTNLRIGQYGFRREDDGTGKLLSQGISIFHIHVIAIPEF